MTVDAALMGRAAAAAEARMMYTCTVVSPGSGDGPLDPTGWPTNPTGDTVYTGRCRFRMRGTISGSSSEDVADDRVFLSQPILSLPLSAPPIPVGSVITITAVPADDPGAHLWLGLRMRVVGRILGSQMSAQRVTVEVVTG